MIFSASVGGISDRPSKGGRLLILFLTALFCALPAGGEEQVEEKLKRLASQVAEIARKEEGIKDRISLLKKRTMLSELTVSKLKKEKESRSKELDSVKRDIGVLEQEEDRINEYFRARVKFQYLLGFLSEYRMISSVSSTEDLRQASFYMSMLSERDRKKLDGLEMLKKGKREKEAECASKIAQIEKIETDSALEKRMLAEEIRQTNDLLEKLSRNSDTARQALRESLENARKMESYLKDPGFKDRVEMYGKNILLFKGKLPPPLKGRVAQDFGDYIHPRFRTKLPHPGLDIEAPLGTPVNSVFEGEVVYSGWLSGYGYTVIVAHPGGIFSLLSHLDRIEVKPGDVVAGGQRLGTSGGDPTRDYSGIYFELRQGKDPVDPAKWIREK